MSEVTHTERTAGQDTRPRLVRYAEQQLRQGWDLTVDHDQRHAFWTRGTSRLTGHYDYAELIIELFGADYGQRINERGRQTPRPQPTEDAMTALATEDKGKTTTKTGDAPALDIDGVSIVDGVLHLHRRTYTPTEVGKMVGLTRDGVRYDKTLTQTKTAWLNATQRMWEVHTDQALLAYLDRRQVAAVIDIRDEEADDADAEMDEEVARARKAVERVKAAAARPKETRLEDTRRTNGQAPDRPAEGRQETLEANYPKRGLAHIIVQPLGLFEIRGRWYHSHDLEEHDGETVRVLWTWDESTEGLPDSVLVADDATGRLIATARLVAEDDGETEAVMSIPFTQREIDRARKVVDSMLSETEEPAATGDGESIDVADPAEVAPPYRVNEVYRDTSSTVEWLRREIAAARAEVERARILDDVDLRRTAWARLEAAEVDAQRYISARQGEIRTLRRALKRPFLFYL